MDVIEKIKGLHFSDIVPPVVWKAAGKLARQFSGQNRYIYPFQYVPREIKAGWVLDIGANVGDVSLAALKTFPSCKVICFEPVNETFSILSKRLLPYKDRVFLFHEALSDTNGEAEINVTSFHGANSIEPQSEFHKKNNPAVQELGKQKIKLQKLDDLVSTFPSDHIDIMKIDVEGHELQVLEGGRNFIEKKVDTVIIEIAFQREQSWEEQKFLSVFSLLKNLGFCLVNIYDVCNADNSQTDSNLLISQMDCVFMHSSKLIKHNSRG